MFELIRRFRRLNELEEKLVEQQEQIEYLRGLNGGLQLRNAKICAVARDVSNARNKGLGWPAIQNNIERLEAVCN